MSGEEPWAGNYFNYFTEIEEGFQRARGTGLFLLSPLDWALIENWKEAGIPLAAVLRGIDAAFEKWRGKKSKIEKVNSLAYCAQAVLAEARACADNAPPPAPAAAAAPFSLDELAAYLGANAAALRRPGRPALEEIASALDRIAGEAQDHYGRLEDLERRLTALEDKMVATLRTLESEEEVLAGRREFDLQLRPYRSRMTAEQIAMLERQFLERRLLESYGLPRLSLFYLR